MGGSQLLHSRSLGRILYILSRDSKDFESRKPNSFPCFPFPCSAGIKTPYPTSYSSAITSNHKLPAGFTHTPASACSEKGSTAAGGNMKAPAGSCWKFTCTWLTHCLSWAGPSLTGYHLRRLQVSGRTAKLESTTHLYVPKGKTTLCPQPLKEQLSD
jgi:hypothetical protein